MGARELAPDLHIRWVWRCANGHAGISPEMALRIEAWLGKERGGDARVWLGQQMA